MAAPKLDLDGKPTKAMTICMLGAGGFMTETPQTVLAVDVYNDKIKHLLSPEEEMPSDYHRRIHFYCLNIKHNSRLEDLIKISDLTIYLVAIYTPADYNTSPLETIYRKSLIPFLLDMHSMEMKQVKYCSEKSKRLIHFSTCEVYGKTIRSFLPKKSPLETGMPHHAFFGPMEKQRWSYACAEQLIELTFFGTGNGLEFTIVGPFNWIGPRMDFIPGIDGPSEGVPRVLACFSNNLLCGEAPKLVDSGQSQRTFLYIKDAMEAVLLMIVFSSATLSCFKDIK
ncbi:hypothetical protein J5N97_012262 [Dioscorea zingiberensis]|uniref:NAD-dependent epimerase/dehydratase domain-containing protein n=1 Tax=Dioscorea zingiberensis TaxID=325984 RepID=A0A9D5HHN5_9LILI|nr:hypothetical protein J5N97_012262 [Dioscorea zingiberensis]